MKPPLRLLKTLRFAFDQLHAASANTEPNGYGLHPNRKVIAGDGFSIYHLLRVNSLIDYAAFQPISLYIRPYGDTAFDPQYEYGKPGEGVEASINYNIDISGGAPESLEFGKHHGPDEDTRISIRLDREGIRQSERMNWGVKDPTQKSGMLSLDVGSIIGGDEWISTQVARFLAWGNELRTRTQGEHTDWNHTRVYFTDEDGDADVFAQEALKIQTTMGDHNMAPEKINILLAGRAAIQGSTK